MTTALWLFVVLGLFLLIFYAICSAQDRYKRAKRSIQRSISPQTRQSLQPVPSPAVAHLPSAAEQAFQPSELSARIEQLLRGDRAATNRLIAAAQAKYPGKPSRWYEEKVLHDLERDRR